MPLTANEGILLGAGDDDDELDIRYERRDRAPDDNRKIGRVTLILMILNRIIGSGIVPLHRCMNYWPVRVLDSMARGGCSWDFYSNEIERQDLAALERGDDG